MREINDLKALEGSRENARVFYDHYRIKVGKLEKSHAQASDGKKQEKYQRNVGKLNEVKKKFEEETRKLEQLMD